MLKVIYGEIAEADTDVIVNAANGCGWMGGKRCRNELRRGVAEHLNFYTKGALEEEAVRAARRSPRIPALFRGQEPGGFFTTPPCGLHCKEVIHAVTMRYPGHRSRLENIRSVLSKIFLYCKSAGFRDIAIPYLGCGTGGLDREDVHALLEEADGLFPDLNILVYDLAPGTD